MFGPKNIYIEKRHSRLIFSRQCAYHHIIRPWEKNIQRTWQKCWHFRIVSFIAFLLFSPPSLLSPRITNLDAALTIYPYINPQICYNILHFFSLLLCPVQTEEKTSGGDWDVRSTQGANMNSNILSRNEQRSRDVIHTKQDNIPLCEVCST